MNYPVGLTTLAIIIAILLLWLYIKHQAREWLESFAPHLDTWIKGEKITLVVSPV